MAKQWFHRASEGQASGPVDSAELRRLAKAGIVRPDTLVRRGDSGRWVRAENVRGLLQRSTPAPSSTPATLPLPTPVPQSGALVNEESEKPKRVWPVTWAAIIVGSGTVLLLLWALVFRGGSEPQQLAEKDQPPLAAAQSAESASAPAPQPLAPLSSAQLYARSSPSVVTVTVLNEKGQEIGTGSGFLLDESWIHGRYKFFDRLNTPDYRDNFGKDLAPLLDVESGPVRVGCLVTNHHVIDAALDIHVTLPDGSRGRVMEVVTESEEMDLAVLFAEFISEAPLTTLNLADATPPVGSKVFAIGNPKGLANSLSEGIVSGYRDISPGVRWLQTTAPISPGSSGGPLLLTDGRVVGVMTAMRREGQNLNFAVPSVEVRRFLAEPFVSRELWKGRSYKKEESQAYGVTGPLAQELHDANPAKWKDAVLTAVRNFNSFRFGRITADELLSAASAALPSIPKEHKYLAFYVQGRAHCELAADRKRPDFRTAEEYYARYAGNPHVRQAVALFEQVVRERPDFAPGYARLVKCRIYGGEWAEGLLAADSLVKLVPRCADAYMQRGTCFRELERYNLALNDFQMVVELDPKNGLVWNKLAWVYLALGEYDKAIEAYETILRGSAALDPPKQYAEFGIPTSLCYFQIGLAHERAGRFQQAIKFFELAKTHGYVREWCDDKIRKCRAKMR